jgi:hypothetical protein
MRVNRGRKRQIVAPTHYSVICRTGKEVREKIEEVNSAKTYTTNDDSHTILNECLFLWLYSLILGCYTVFAFGRYWHCMWVLSHRCQHLLWSYPTVTPYVMPDLYIRRLAVCPSDRRHYSCGVPVLLPSSYLSQPSYSSTCLASGCDG